MIYQALYFSINYYICSMKVQAAVEWKLLLFFEMRNYML